MGIYFQDDWKATKRLTLQLGLRWDLYSRHSELNNQATTFIPGPGSNTLEQLINANVPAGSPGCDTNEAQMAMSTLAGVCGPGGFAASSSLGKGRHKDFGPRVGFAYDVFGNGKTSVRGGFGLAYEGTLYNPLSNSRWNLPYYSFNSEYNFLGGDVNTVVWGPTNCIPSVGCTPTRRRAQFGPGGVAPTYSGPPTNPNQGLLERRPPATLMAGMARILTRHCLQESSSRRALMIPTCTTTTSAFSTRSCPGRCWRWTSWAQPVTSCSALRTSTARLAPCCRRAPRSSTTSARR